MIRDALGIVLDTLDSEKWVLRALAQEVSLKLHKFWKERRSDETDRGWSIPTSDERRDS
jgi:hypothetical protein